MDLKILRKSKIPIETLYKAICASKEGSKRYNKGNVLYDYWFNNKSKMVGWTFNEFSNHIHNLDKIKVELDYNESHRKYGDFSQWI